MGLAIDLHENLVQMPLPLPLPIRMSTNLQNPFISDFSRKQRDKSLSPETDGFVAHIDATLM